MADGTDRPCRTSVGNGTQIGMCVRRLLGLLAVMVLASLTMLPAAAETAADELGVQVVVGYGGVGGDGLWQPVEVHLAPTRPVAGTLSVTASAFTGTRVAVDVPIEVAAASREIHRVLVPAGSLAVRISERGRDPVNLRPTMPPESNEFLIGILGEVPDGVPPVRSEPTGLSGRWVPVAPEWIEQSHLALGPLGTLVAARPALDALAPKARQNLAAAVAAGTDLVIVVEAGADAAVGGLGLESVQDVAAAPGSGLVAPTGAWSVTEAPTAPTAGDARGASASAGAIIAVAQPAGYGRVTVTTVQPGDSSGSEWSQLVSPRPLTGTAEAQFAPTRTPYQFPALVAEQQAGDTPRLPWLGAFVVAYVLVVGPVNGIVLARMRRRELAWLTVPIVTVVFTAGGYFGATGGRPVTGTSAHLATWIEGAATEFVAAGVRSARPSERTVTFAGSDWTLRPLVDGVRPPRVGRGPDVTARLRLTALQLGGVAAWRTISAPPPLRVEPQLTPEGNIAVTVTNIGSRTIADVHIEVAGAEEGLGDLAVDASQTVELSADHLPQLAPYEEPLMEFDVDGPRRALAPETLDDVLTETSLHRPGMIWAVGTDVGAPAAAVTDEGTRLRSLGSRVAVAAPLPAGKDLVSPFAVRRDLVVTSRGHEAMQPAPNSIDGAAEAYLRFRLPPGAQAADLANELETGAAGGSIEMTVWDHNERTWLAVDSALPDDGPPARGVVGPLGEVWARATGELFPFEFSARTIVDDTL